MSLARPFQLVLAAYLAVYLVWGGPLSAGLWLRGGHATPDQWAYHALLEGLGFGHHHGPAETPAPAEDAPVSAPGVAVAARVPQPEIVAPAPVSGPSPDTTLSQRAEEPATLGPLQPTGSRPAWSAETRPRSRSADPPDPPPRSHR